MMGRGKRNVRNLYVNEVISVPKKRRTERPRSGVEEERQAKKMVFILRKPDQVKLKAEKKKHFLEKISKVNNPYSLCKSVSPELDGFGIVEGFEWMGWEPILHFENGYYPELCMQFYANLELINDQKVLKTVVEGKEILLTREIIAKIFGLEEGEEHKQVWSKESVLKEPNLKSMIGFLIGETDLDKINLQEPVKTNRLATLARALSHIFFHIVHPRGCPERMNLSECYVIYHMINKTQKISLAYIMFWNMWGVVDNSRKGKLIYCNLLSKLFVHFNVIGKHEIEMGNGVHTMKKLSFHNIVFDENGNETKSIRDKCPSSQAPTDVQPPSTTAPSTQTNSGEHKISSEHIKNAHQCADSLGDDVVIKDENPPEDQQFDVTGGDDFDSFTLVENREAEPEVKTSFSSAKRFDISKEVETTLNELRENQLNLWKIMKVSAGRERKRYQRFVAQTKIIKEMKQMLDQKVIGEFSELTHAAATTTAKLPSPALISHTAPWSALFDSTSTPTVPKLTLTPADLEAIQSIIFKSAAASGAHFEQLMESEHVTIHQRFNWIQDDLKATLNTIHNSVQKIGALVQKRASDELVHLKIIHNSILQYGQKQDDLQATLSTIHDSVQKIGAIAQQHASDELVNLNIINTSIHEYGRKQNENHKSQQAATEETQVYLQGIQQTLNKFAPVSYDIGPNL